MGLFCSDCSRKGGGFVSMGFQISQGPPGTCSKIPWMYMCSHCQVGFFEPVIGNLLTGIQGISYLSTSQTLFPPIYFYFPTTFLFQSEKERSDLDSQKEKMCCFPPKSGFLFQISLDSSEAKTWQWWPLTSDSPQGPLTRKAICIEQKRGAEKTIGCVHHQVLPTPYCVARPLGPLLWIQGPPPPQKMHNMGFFFLSFFVFIRQWDHHQHKTRQPRGIACFVLLPPLTRKRGTSLSEKKETRKEKRE
jgi:hypothetical protein